MQLFDQKYRIDSVRLAGWNYLNGLYFITICTKNRECNFGEVRGKRMILSAIGAIAEKCWREIPEHFQHARLDALVIMPNHMHGIIGIANPTMETRHVASLQKRERTFGGLSAGSLPKIMQAYKAAVTRWCRLNGHAEFGWQSRYYEHIIRNEESLNRIRDYIISNPATWDEDQENPSYPAK